MTGRPSAAQRGYDASWRRAREAHLRANPRCTEPGCLRPACHVHHGTRHRGDGAKFWDRSTWRGLCAEHHNRDAQQRETRGYSNRLGNDGLPVDPNHPFNRAEVR